MCKNSHFAQLISRILSSGKNKTLHPLNKISSYALPTRPVSINLITLDTLYKCNHVFFILFATGLFSLA